MHKYAKRMDNMTPSAIREAGKMIAAKKGCISFAAGFPSPTLMPMDAITKISNELLTEVGTSTVQYGPTKGTAEILTEVIKFVKKKNINASEKNIQITTGSQQGIFVSAMMMLDEGDAVVVEKPTYLGAMSAFTPLMCRYVDIEADDDGMDISALEEKVKSDKGIKMIYVVPNFSNPTGKQWSLERRKGLLEIANKYDLVIIEDDPYGDILFDGEPLPSIKSMDTEERVIYLGSFSKILFAGLRVGFTIASEDMTNRFEQFKNGIDLQTNQFAQMQVARYLQTEDLDAQIAKIIESYKEKRDLMIKLIDELFPKSCKRTNPKGGMFVWLTLDESVDTFKLLPKCIEEANVGYVPGGPFYANEKCNNTIRLNFSTVDKEQIQEGMERLAKFLHTI